MSVLTFHDFFLPSKIKNTSPYRTRIPSWQIFFELFISKSEKFQLFRAIKTPRGDNYQNIYSVWSINRLVALAEIRENRFREKQKVRLISVLRQLVTGMMQDHSPIYASFVFRLVSIWMTVKLSLSF